MKIAFITGDWSQTIVDEEGKPVPGGAGWYRMVLPAEALRKNDYDVVIGQHIRVTDGVIEPADMEGNFHDDCDIIVFQRWMFYEAPRVFQDAKALGQIIVNDIDDWFFGLHPSNMAWLQSHPKYSAEANVNHYRKALASSSALTVSTQYLADRLRNLGVPTYVLRNAIRVDDFGGLKLESEKPTLGWIGATTHRSGDLETLKGILGPFVEKHDLSVFHGGDRGPEYPSFASVTGVNPERVTALPMTPIHLYPSYFKHFDIGIAPLADNPFNLSKSWIKLLEYSSARIPSIGSETFEYKSLGSSLLAKRPKDWIRNLEKLMDLEERKRWSTRAFHAAEAQDIQNRWKDWAITYQKILSL